MLLTAEDRRDEVLRVVGVAEGRGLVSANHMREAVPGEKVLSGSFVEEVGGAALEVRHVAVLGKLGAAQLIGVHHVEVLLHVTGVGPEQFPGYFGLRLRVGEDRGEGLDGGQRGGVGGEAAVDGEDLLVDGGGDGQSVKELVDRRPNGLPVHWAILPGTLRLEAVLLLKSSNFVVPPEEGDLLRT